LDWNDPVGLEHLPGGDLVEKGQRDLQDRLETVEALLVSIGAPRLRGSGLRVAAALPDAEHRLYEMLARIDPDSAHSRYNALLRRLTSFESALECVP
jgi:hypothetical protein